MVSKDKKLLLIERLLGLRHKLKVNESGHAPQNHKELANLMVANWELEDEIAAIEEVINQARNENKKEKLAQITKDYLTASGGSKSKKKEKDLA